MTALVSARVDKATKQQFKTMCESAGITQSVALGMIVKNFMNNSMPIHILAPPTKMIVKDFFTDTQNNTAGKKMTRAEMFGCMRGQIEMSDDFDEPLDDFREYME